MDARVRAAQSMTSAFLLLAAACVHPSAVDAAEGNRLFALGAVQKSLGGAGVASPQDATWILLNPASLADLRGRVDASWELLRNDLASEPAGSRLAVNPLAGRMRDSHWISVPSFAVACPWAGGIVGFGLFGTQGNRSHFDAPRSTPGLFLGVDRRSNYEVVRAPLAYAKRFECGWAVGASLVLAHSRMRADSVTPSLRPTAGGFGWDDAFGAGFQVGVHRRWPRWSVGLSYASPTWCNDFDLYSPDLARWSLDLPETVQLGIALRPSRKLEVLLDYAWIHWQDVAFYGKNPERGGLGWQDQHLLKAGLIWNLNDRWSLRLGASVGNSPVDREHVFVNALAPALAEVHLGAGLSYRVGPHVTLHFAYAQALDRELTDNGRGGVFSLLGKGTHVGYAEDSITVQWSYNF